MIIKDGIQYRNLEEQVKKNQDDIKYLEESGITLANYGIHIKDVVATTANIPYFNDPSNYPGETGDGYAVGLLQPYDIYVYTSVESSDKDFTWLNLGKFPAIGPKGEKGDKGDKGDIGLTGPAGPTGSQGPQGTVGPQGPQGPIGLQGEQGVQGIQGETGTIIKIAAKWPYDISELANNPLPTPSSLNDPSIAYLVMENKSATPVIYDTFVQIGDSSLTRTWQNVGPITGGTDVYVGGQYVSTFDADTKLNKVGNTTRWNKVVGIDTSGAQRSYAVSQAADMTTIAMRTPTGRIKAKNPSESDDVTTKTYVDTAIQAIYDSNTVGYNAARMYSTKMDTTIVPIVTKTIDIGTSRSMFKNGYIDSIWTGQDDSAIDNINNGYLDLRSVNFEYKWLDNPVSGCAVDYAYGICGASRPLSSFDDTVYEDYGYNTNKMGIYPIWEGSLYAGNGGTIELNTFEGNLYQECYNFFVFECGIANQLIIVRNNLGVGSNGIAALPGDSAFAYQFYYDNENDVDKITITPVTANPEIKRVFGLVL